MIRKTIALSVYISLVTALAGAVDVNIQVLIIIEFLQMLMKVMYIDSSIKNIQDRH